MDHVRLEAKIDDPLYDIRPIVEGIHEQNRTTVEWLHLRERGVHGEWAYLRGEGEVELGAVADLRLYPHITLHEGNETFGYR